MDMETKMLKIQDRVQRAKAEMTRLYEKHAIERKIENRTQRYHSTNVTSAPPLQHSRSFIYAALRLQHLARRSS